MSARRKTVRPPGSDKDREFERLLRKASRLVGPPQPLSWIKLPQSTQGKPK